MNKHTLKVTGMAVIVIALIAIAYFFLFVQQSAEYSIVYLSTGEIYIGHLSTFPRLKLTDSYLFQGVPDPADSKKTTFQLTPLRDALWAPQYLYLNPDHVLFSGPLSETSSMLKTLRNPVNNSATITPIDNPAGHPAQTTKEENKPK